jgi:hypothetical protein
MTKESDDVRRCGQQMAFHMEEIAKLFKPGVKLTLLVRNPGHPERNAFLSDEDNIDEAVEAIKQLKNPTGAIIHV